MLHFSFQDKKAAPKAIDNKLATKAEVEKVAEESSMEADEAKKIVESITDSITSGEKQECKYETVQAFISCRNTIQIVLFTKINFTT